jgi:sugar lactone lactonase YvrE
MWERADLSIQRGLVDAVHVDANGQVWAFVTIGGESSAVNCKFARRDEG